MFSILRMLLVALQAAALAMPAGAQTYPTKPVRLIIPYAGGGSSDFVGRLVAQKLSEAWGQQVLPDNRPGANGNIGVEIASKSRPDGYTLLLASGVVHFIINPTIYENLRQDLIREFDPITLIVFSYTVLVTNSSVPARDVKELIAYAKANPGKINYASPGTGTPNHLGMALLALSSGAPMVHVPYKSSGQVMPDLISGEVQVTLATLPAVGPHLNGGRIRVLGVGAPQRLSALPDAPAIAEGGFPGFEASNDWSLFAPAGTPRAVINRAHGEVAKMLTASDMREKLNKAGLTPVGSTPAELSARLKDDLNKWPKVIREAGIKVTQ